MNISSKIAYSKNQLFYFTCQGVQVEGLLIKEKKDLIDFKKKKLYPKKILKPEGLSPKRQWYLYEEIREHILSEKDQNITCPRPECPKPKEVST